MVTRTISAAEHPNANLSDEMARELAHEGTVRRNDGFVWRFDPKHRLPFAQPYVEDNAVAHYERIEAPTLLIEGSRSVFHNDSLDRRRKAYRNARLITFDGAGHMIHHEEPSRLAHEISSFIRNTRAGKARD